MLTENEPLVSVITPVYNGERFLSECLESVRTQTYSNFEHIIVNNCSTDSTLEIAQDYASRDPRIRIHNNNDFVTALENHNIALKLISPESKYVKIVQADDLIFPECIARMVAIALEYPSVGLVSAYRLEGNEVTLDGLAYPSPFLPGTEISRQTLLTDLYVFGSPTSLLMRSDLVRSRPVFYDEANFALEADSAVCYDILKTSDFGFVHQVLTFTRRHDDQLTTVATRLRTYTVGRIRVLDRYAPHYLSETEYSRRRKELMDPYLRGIGWMALTQNEEAIWRFHKKALQDFGYKHVSLTIITAAAVTVGTRLWEAVHKVAQTLKAVVMAVGRIMVRAVRRSTRGTET
jgi:glycosyltransferase involved in cell wall biosynthesis